MELTTENAENAKNAKNAEIAQTSSFSSGGFGDVDLGMESGDKMGINSKMCSL